jgi:uncharacterized protein involved in exopolysaccharide biosynthesis
MTQVNNEKINSDEISLKELILKIQEWCKYLLSRWIIVSVLTVLGIVIGLIYYGNSKPQYKAELTFVYGESSSNQFSGLSSLASQFGLSGGSSGSSVFDGQNLLELMQSRKIIQKVLLSQVLYKNKKTSIADIYIDVYKFRDKWREKKSKLENISFNNVDDTQQLSIDQNVVLGGIYGAIKAKNLIVGKSDKESSIMSMVFLSESEELSKYFVELLSQKVSKYYIETKTKKASDNVSTLQRQTDSVRRALGNAIRGVASNIDVNPNPNPTLRSLMVPSQNKQVDVQTNQAILTILVQNLEIAKISLRNETPLIQPIDEPTLPLDVIQLSLFRAILRGALGGFIVAILLVSAKMFFKNLVNS